MAINKLLANIFKTPNNAVKTLTLDNGSEFIMHAEIKKVVGIQSCFCHSGSSWEKPYVENSHVILHRFL